MTPKPKKVKDCDACFQPFITGWKPVTVVIDDSEHVTTHRLCRFCAKHKNRRYVRDGLVEAAKIRADQAAQETKG